MSAPSEQDVIDMVRWLQDMPGEKEMRERTARIHDLVAMEMEYELPEHVGRGQTRALPLNDLLDMAYAIQAERHSYQTSVVLTALDNTPPSTVDRIEKALAIRVGQHKRRWLVEDEGGFHQMLSYAGVITWHCDDPTGPEPTRIELADVDSCFFPVRGAGRPALFAQRYRVLLGDVESMFKNGMRDGYSPYMKQDGSWSRYKLGEDRPSQGMSDSGQTGSSRFAQDTEIVHLDTGEYVSYLALNRGNTAPQDTRGLMLWQDLNRAGPDEAGRKAAAAIVVPGMVTPMRKPERRLRPMFDPGIQYIHAMNYIIEIMATKAENNTGDVLVEQSPEQIIAAASVGMTSPTVQELEQGNPSIVPLTGKPTLWERLPEPYLMKLLDLFSLRYDRWSNSLREISDPTLLAAINTNVYLPHAAARRKLMGPMLDQADAAMKELVRMDMNQLQYLGAKKVSYTASGGERYGNLAQEVTRGEVVQLAWADVKDFDKRFRLSVSTNSMSEAEQRQQLLAHKEKVMMGYATDRQGVSVAGYSDEEAQIETLAVDEVYQEATALVRPQTAPTIQETIRLAGGIVLDLAPPAPEPAGAPPAPDQGTTYNTPAIPGGRGQSAPVVG